MTSAVPTASAPERLVAVAAQEPSRPLLTFLDAGVEHSYGSFLDTTLTWAAAFRRIGVAPGTAVAAMVGSGPDGYATWMGVAWLRAVEVPVNLDYQGVLLAHVLTSSATRLVVCERPYLDALLAVADDVPLLDTVVLLDDEPVVGVPWTVLSRSEFLAGVEPLTADDPPTSADIAAVVYTSGTTGPSKGVIIPWRSLNSFRTYPPGMTGAALRIYSPWPLFHLTGKMTLNDAITLRGSAVVRRRWRTDLFWPDVRENGVTATLLLAGMSYFLWNLPRTPEDADNPLRRVHMAPVIPEHREFEDRFAVQITAGYASSEAGMVTRHEYPVSATGTVGYVNPGYEVKLVDPEGREVPVGQAGEALIRTTDRTVMSLGYWNMPEATEKAWRGGWFHSGDGLRRDAEGRYFFVDRVKDSMRRRGENISSIELESIVDSHPDVVESAAVGVASSAVDEEILVAVVLRAGAAHDPAGLVAFLKARAPKFMVPRYVRFLAELPRTVTGRVRKVELRADGVTHDTWDREGT